MYIYICAYTYVHNYYSMCSPRPYSTTQRSIELTLSGVPYIYIQMNMHMRIYVYYNFILFFRFSPRLATPCSMTQRSMCALNSR